MLPDFIRSHTIATPVPLVPEITIYQADEPIALWEKTEESGTEQPPPFWAFPWAGGQALARHILDHPQLVAGRSVLDLATGSGLVALAAVRAGADPVTANDVDPLSLAAAEANAALNGMSLRTREADLLDSTPTEQVILAGDVFYSRAMAARVLPFLRRAAAGGALVLVGDPGRAYRPEGLRQRAIHEVPVPESLEGVSSRTTTVWEMQKL
ncbi:class I SAM-dependent methyltransferase [Paractinoplanes rishiriensis]|uniref:Nicotinamide N-methylase n=1 Tax=Paractinoplanes rishiriensis TaxID=1050105 RepID=A0A919JUE6_9ACTN|nr:50S ribosomal protein L11 methyltransferase [Actinoplanes rishiriensis]GIE93363.1 nicotinamide N-methylase [Actinoplanes rishiriensis]